MRLGEVFSGTVRDLTSAGMGVVAHPSGRVVFVSGVWVGEAGQFRIVEKRGRVGVAEIFSLSQKNPRRVAPRCSHHGVTNKSCGACPWQFIDYQEQLDVKQKRVVDTLARIDKSVSVKPIWASEKQYAYRGRAQLKTDGVSLGYLAKQSHSLVNIQECPILTKQNQTTLHDLREKLPNPVWKPKARHKWTTLDIDESVGCDSASINKRLSFAQANDSQNTRMKAWLNQHLHELNKVSKAIELFCGSGNFTEVLAQAGIHEIDVFECDEHAIKVLRRRELPQVNTHVADLFSEKSLERLFTLHGDAEILVVDPPRDGLKCTAGMFNKSNRLNHVFYISCDTATFTRDLKLFYENGYRVIELQPVDQFPHTPHIELLCYLRKH